MNLAELEIYGSTIPQYVVNYVDKLREEEVHIKDKCRLPYLWLPNNIHRMLNCPLDDRVKLYLSKIQPNIDYYRHLDILELLGVQFVFVNERLDLPYMEFLEEVEPEEEDKPGLYLYRVLSGTSERPFGVGTFLPAPGEGEAACQWREGQDWRLVNIQTDLMGNKPIFRDRYEIGFDAPEKGCLLVPWTYSKLWSFNINGREVSPRLADTMFMSVPVEKGANAIVAHYHPRFRRHLAFSFGVTVLGVIWAVWFYMRCRKKVQGESEKEDRKKPGRGIQ